MHKWEFFQDLKGAWRWRRTSEDGRSIVEATESYQSRAGAVYDAKTRGYTDGAAQPDLAIDETLVNLKALGDDALPPGSALRRSGYNPYDTGPTNPKPERKR